jgi:cyclopropane fatty-acyl-phospholipid synthase-like methyltransferase
MKFIDSARSLFSRRDKETSTSNHSIHLNRSKASLVSSCVSLHHDIDNELDKDAIAGLGFLLFWKSRIFLASVEIGIYTELSLEPSGLTHGSLIDRLSLHERLRPDFFDALVSLHVLDRIGNGPDARYVNTPESEHYLVKTRANTYIGDWMVSLGKRFYPMWADYPQSLVDGTIKCPRIQDVLDQRDKKISQYQGQELCPENMIRLAYAFVPSRVFLAAFQLNIFATIQNSKKQSLSAKQVCKKLSLIDLESTTDFLTSLVEMNVLLSDVTLEGKTIFYNTTEISKMVTVDPTAVNIDFLIMSSARLYRFWSDLPDALVTGFKQNECIKRQVHIELYDNPELLNVFLRGMNGYSFDIRSAFLEKFDFTPYHTVTDVGGATGLLSIAIAKQYPHIAQCITTDLPQVGPLAARVISKSLLTDQNRVMFVGSDFLKEEIPSSDVIIMSIVLHDWPLQVKKMLLEKGYRSLPENGVLVVIDSLIDDDRRTHTYGLCMSINMLIEFGVDGGYDHTGADLRTLCQQVGFACNEIRPLTATHSMCIAYKKK